MLCTVALGVMAASGTMNNFTFGNAATNITKPSAGGSGAGAISMAQMRFKHMTNLPPH